MMVATCMLCGKTWKFDPAKVDFDVPYEAGDELVSALCETCAGTVDVDQIVARMRAAQPNFVDTVEVWGSSDKKFYKITTGMKRRVQQMLGQWEDYPGEAEADTQESRRIEQIFGTNQ